MTAARWSVAAAAGIDGDRVALMDYPARRDSLLSVAHVPDRVRAVIGHVHRTVLRNRNTDWPSPGLTFRRHEPGQEIFIHAAGLAFVQRDAHYFVARHHGPIPRSVLGGEQISLIFFRKLVPLVEGQSERRAVRLDQDIGNNRF